MNSIRGRHRPGQFTHQRTGPFSIQTCDTSKTEGGNQNKSLHVMSEFS